MRIPVIMQQPLLTAIISILILSAMAVTTIQAAEDKPFAEHKVVLQISDSDPYKQTLVLNVDREQRRIGLSLKQMEPDPWSLVAERYQVGELVRVVITNVVDFGAFARVEEGVEGLIHISELAEGNFLHPRNVIQEGDVVLVRILNIDGDNHRLGLSLRQAWEPDLGPIPPREQGFGYEVL